MSTTKMSTSRGTYEWQLEFLCRISMFDNKLTESLSDTMPTPIFADLIELIIRQVELVFRLIVRPKPFPRSDNIHYCSTVFNDATR